MTKRSDCGRQISSLTVRALNKMRRAGPPLAIVPSCPARDDRLGHRTRHRGRIAERMIEVQNPHGLTKSIDHVVIAISMERITAIVAGDRDRYAAPADFVDRRDAAPARRPLTAPVLKIKIYGWQRDHGDTRFGAEVEGPTDLLFGLDR